MNRQSHRMPSGGRIDRERPLRFSFNDKVYYGYRGDTLASALLANDVRLVGRSFKYHRPRGIVAAGAEEPNALVQLGSGGRTQPNLRATQVELYSGLSAHSVNVWPSVERDLRAVNGVAAPLMPAGFYYKTFMASPRAWKKFEHHIRKAAGLGKAPTRPDPDDYDRVNHHCDVLVVGAGPAGLSAALAAGRAGARVLLVDEQPETGGSLLASAELIDGRPALDWVAHARAELDALDNVRTLVRTTAFGYYDHNFLALLERLTDHIEPSPAPAPPPRQRLWRVRARQVVLAAGAFERPLVFGNNDRPGVMIASAVSTYLRRYAVRPCRQALVFTNNDSAYQTALDLHHAGIPVGVIDVRPEPLGTLPRWVRERGIDVFAGRAICDVQGAKRMEGARVIDAIERRTALREDKTGMRCDLIAVSGGWNPAVHLHAQSGGRPVWDDDAVCFKPGVSVQAERSAGACAGEFTLGGCLEQGWAAGAGAADALGLQSPAPQLPSVNRFGEEPLRPLWRVPSGVKKGGPKQFVDLQNDTTVADIQLAAREGFESIEHVKRYTALGFGTDQGKLGNVNGMAILARELGQTIAETGTTTYRPAYTPVAFGALAGPDSGELFDPLRVTALHDWHRGHGARFEDVGQWQRPWYYPRGDEDLQRAVNRECLAVRRGVGIFDGSTLGKIDIQGPDAVALLNWVYTNRWDKLAVGRCRYGLMLGEDGMVMDDGVTTRLGEQHFLMTTTTGNAAAVLDWMERWLQTEWHLDVYLNSVTDHWATIALAGPDSRALLGEACEDIDLDGSAFPFMSYRDGVVAGVAARVMRISFSGELAYEINVPANAARHVWETLMARGEAYAVTPYGTEAMHVLRAEKGYIIVGQETDGSVTPDDLGLQGMVSQSKEFLGKRSLQRPYCQAADRKQLVGLRSLDRQQTLSEGAAVINDSSDLEQTPLFAEGHVTSAYYSAALERPIALALIKNGHTRLGNTVYAVAAGAEPIAVEIVEPVFYDPQGERLHG